MKKNIFNTVAIISAFLFIAAVNFEIKAAAGTSEDKLSVAGLAAQVGQSLPEAQKNMLFTMLEYVITKAADDENGEAYKGLKMFTLAFLNSKAAMAAIEEWRTQNTPIADLQQGKKGKGGKKSDSKKNADATP